MKADGERQNPLTREGLGCPGLRWRIQLQWSCGRIRCNRAACLLRAVYGKSEGSGSFLGVYGSSASGTKVSKRMRTDRGQSVKNKARGIVSYVYCTDETENATIYNLQVGEESNNVGNKR